MDLPERGARGGVKVDEEIWLVLSTFPDAATASRIAGELVEGNLAACANLLPAIESIYRWEGKLERTAETLVLFKLCARRYPEFEAGLQARHPYEVPEIIALPLAHALPAYARWVEQNSGAPSGSR